MRENRQSGSVGGGAPEMGASYPRSRLSVPRASARGTSGARHEQQRLDQDAEINEPSTCVVAR